MVAILNAHNGQQEFAMPKIQKRQFIHVYHTNYYSSLLLVQWLQLATT
jgi:hypothetical protein